MVALAPSLGFSLSFCAMAGTERLTTAPTTSRPARSRRENIGPPEIRERKFAVWGLGSLTQDHSFLSPRGRDTRESSKIHLTAGTRCALLTSRRLTEAKLTKEKSMDLISTLPGSMMEGF